MLKLVLRPFYRSFNWIYWVINNQIRKTNVEGTGVSHHANIGKYAIVRAGSEVGPDVVLGDYSYISGPRSYVEAARIGKFCSIARQVTIGPSDHDMAAVTTHPFRLSPAFGGIINASKETKQKEPPVIGNDVWIGINSIVMRGVIVGDGAIVAANSVVTRDVPPFAIVAGVPAKIIRYRFSAEVIMHLKRICWWDWPVEKLKKFVADFDSPTEFTRVHRD